MPLNMTNFSTSVVQSSTRKNFKNDCSSCKKVHIIYCQRTTVNLAFSANTVRTVLALPIVLNALNVGFVVVS